MNILQKNRHMSACNTQQERLIMWPFGDGFEKLMIGVLTMIGGTGIISSVKLLTGHGKRIRDLEEQAALQEKENVSIASKIEALKMQHGEILTELKTASEKRGEVYRRLDDLNVKVANNGAVAESLKPQLDAVSSDIKLLLQDRLAKG
jgi:hypothetical protein